MNSPVIDRKHLAACIRSAYTRATEGAWQWGQAGPCNFVAFGGDDIVGVATFRAKSDADLAGLLQRNALLIADALDPPQREVSENGGKA